MNELRVLLLKDGSGWWTAQCLEYDVAAQGRTIRDAVFEFQRTLVSEVTLAVANGDNALETLGQAPGYFWRLFNDDAEPVDIRKLPPFSSPKPIPIPVPMLREARAA